MTLNPLVDEAWDDFRRSLARKGRSARTLDVYRRSYEAFWAWAEKQGIGPDPAGITHTVINQWVDDMLTTPAIRNGQPILDPETGEPRPVALNTVRIRWANLRPFFTWWAAELETVSPFLKADTPKLMERPVPVVSLGDLRALLHAADGKGYEERRDQALIRFMVDVGARVGEVVAMTTDSWDRRNDLVTITGKTGTRIVPVSPSTGEAMARYGRQRNQHAKAHLPAWWLGYKGGLGVSGVAQVLARRSEQAGLERIHPHRLRHSWAHLLKQAGAAEGDLMALGGWSTSATVHRYGRSAAVARAQDAARTIALGDRL